MEGILAHQMKDLEKTRKRDTMHPSKTYPHVVTVDHEG